MTRLGRSIRIHIAWFFLRQSSIRTAYWSLVVRVLGVTINFIIHLDQKEKQRRVEKLGKAVADLEGRMASIKPDLNNLNNLTEHRKSQVLAARSVLKEDADQIIASAKKPSPHLYIGAIVLQPSLTYMHRKFMVIQGRTQSFRRIISGIEGDTFYSDLLLWLVLSGAYDEALIGDLKEEYLLRQSTDGEAHARAWYHHQAFTTTKDYLWTKFERLAAVGTLIDLFNRWFRN
jgi:hypothetical protein